MDGDGAFWIIILIIVLVFGVVLIIDGSHDNRVRAACEVYDYEDGYMSGVYNGEKLCVTETRVVVPLAELEQ